MAKHTVKTWDRAICGDGTFSFTLETSTETLVPKPDGAKWASVRTRANGTAIVSHMEVGDGVQVDTIQDTLFFRGHTRGLNCTGGTNTVIDIVFYSQRPG